MVQLYNEICIFNVLPKRKACGNSSNKQTKNKRVHTDALIHVHMSPGQDSLNTFVPKACDFIQKTQNRIQKGTKYAVCSKTMGMV
jgi:hypothetical protein